MAIPVYLQKFKAAGIYRIVFDKSTILGVDSEILRLVVGYSEKGPFNTPVYITSPSEFVSIYGKGSRKLEKRGIFFHRMALQALSAGPILALNLKKFENEVVNAVALNPKQFSTEKDFVITPAKIKLEDIYDTSRFWKLDENQLQDVTGVTVDPVSQKITQENRVEDSLKGYIKITATNTDNLSNTVIMRKTTNPAVLKSYDVTVNDWYAGEDEGIPE